jgi:hypothetical protein
VTRPYPQALAEALAAGQHREDISVNCGYAEDYGLTGEVARYALVLVDSILLQHDDDTDSTMPAPRRWLFVETGGGLTHDGGDRMTEGRALRGLGWEYVNSGGYRVEVDPATVPAEADWRWQDAEAREPDPGYPAPPKPPIVHPPEALRVDLPERWP